MMARRKVYDPFLFIELTVNGHMYLDTLTKFLMPRLEEDLPHIFQKDGTPLHFHQYVRDHLNDTLIGRWINRAENHDFPFTFWPLRSPDLILCDLFLWRYVKDIVYVLPLL